MITQGSRANERYYRNRVDARSPLHGRRTAQRDDAVAAVFEVERATFDIVLVEFLNAIHPDTDPNRCAHCGGAGTPDAWLLPIGVGNTHTWLHSECWNAWRERRRSQAIATFAEAGITSLTPIARSAVQSSRLDQSPDLTEVC
jgi:hypothetical protein